MASRRAQRGRRGGLRAVRSASILTLAGCAWLQWLGRTSGSTHRERAAPRPGDEVVERPHFVTDHAVTIGASPDE
ncbi:MAG: hypothetical protein AB7G36_18915, partial [Candidatus Nanopelagicales bacterium]